MISRVRGDNSASMDNSNSGLSERLVNELDTEDSFVGEGASANDGLLPFTRSSTQQTAYFNQPNDSANSGDQPALLDLRSNEETMEYAENLARELLNDTNSILVRQKENSTENVSAPETETETEGETGKRENAIIINTDIEGASNENNNKSQQPVLHNNTHFDQLQQTFQTATGNSIRFEDEDEEPEKDNSVGDDKDDNNKENLTHDDDDDDAKNQQIKQLEAEEIAQQLSKEMEFTKEMYTNDFSVDSLLDQGKDDGAASKAQSGGSTAIGSDLADFELPPYSGSSSGSEQAAATSTTKQTSQATRRESSDSGNKDNSTQLSSSVGTAVPDLSAVKSLLASSYSRYSHVFHWKRPIESGIIFSIGLILSIALTFFSIISVVAYTALSIILSSGSMRIYKMIMKTLNKSPVTPFDHLWGKVLDLNVSMSPQRLHELVDSTHRNLNASMLYFKQVLLVEDKLATLKFGIFLYLLTYIGSCFNGMTLIMMVYFGLFSVPLVYEKNKTNIDQYLNLASSKVCSTLSLVTQKVTALTSGGASPGHSKKKN